MVSVGCGPRRPLLYSPLRALPIVRYGGLTSSVELEGYYRFNNFHCTFLIKANEWVHAVENRYVGRNVRRYWVRDFYEF